MKESVPPLKAIDRLLVFWRIAKATPFIPPGGRVLDVGSADGALFRSRAMRHSKGVGIDPQLARSVELGDHRLIAGAFPDDLDDAGPFEAITMLAVLEHLSADELKRVRDACLRLLAPGGVIVATVPSPRVDAILHRLMKLRLIAGMAVHEHHGLDPEAVPSTFTCDGLRLTTRRTFQFGLNNLLVFTRVSTS